MPADDITSLASVSEEVAAGRRRFREELKQIPTLDHEVYGSCLAPVYPSQLLIALGQLASPSDRRMERPGQYRLGR